MEWLEYLQPTLLKYHLTVFAVSVNFFLLIFFVIYNRRYILEVIKKISRTEWFFLSLIFLVGLILRISLPYKQHILISDETFYINAAINMFDFDFLWSYGKSIGWPFILFLVFGFLGASSHLMIFTSILFAALTIFPLFFLVNILFKDKHLAFLSSGLFALLPFHILWSATGETDVSSLFFAVLAMCFSAIYLHNQRLSLLWLSVVALAFAVQFRPENLGLILVFVVLVTVYGNKHRYSFFKNLIVPGFLYFVLTIFNLITIKIYYHNFVKEVGFPKREWGVIDTVGDFFIYNANLFNGMVIPVLWSIFLVIGCYYFYKKNVKLFFVLFVWFFYMIGFYFVFWMNAPDVFAKTYPQYVVVRGFYNAYPCLVIFVSGGFLFLVRYISKFVGETKKIFLIGALGNFLLLSLFPMYFYLRKQG